MILDTTVLISAERGRVDLGKMLGDDDDVAIASVTAAELFVGVELATESHRERRMDFVAGILDLVSVETYGLDVARAHARLIASTRGAGRTRGAHDLMIAATAVARARTVVSADASGFEDLPGVQFRLVASAPGG